MTVKQRRLYSANRNTKKMYEIGSKLTIKDTRTTPLIALNRFSYYCGYKSSYRHKVAFLYIRSFSLVCPVFIM